MKCSHAVLVLSGQEGVRGGVGVSLRQVGVRAHQGCSVLGSDSLLSCAGTWGLRCVDVNMALSSGGITIVPRSPPNLLRFESRGREVMRYSAVSVSGEGGRASAASVGPDLISCQIGCLLVAPQQPLSLSPSLPALTH